MKPRKFSQRLFLAAELPRFAREQIVESRKVWRKQLGQDVKWVPPLHLFLTLRYLGELEVGKSRKLCGKLETRCRSIAPVQLVVDQVGASPSRDEARVLWLGLERSDELDQLRVAIETCCDELKIGKDKKPFEGRINLSRTSEPQAVPELQIKTRLKGFKIKNISLIESRAGQNGPGYHPIRKIALLKPTEA